MKRRRADKISVEFAGRVRSRLKNHLKKIILFGSRARGDSYEGSDYDILIVLDERKKVYENILLN
ncbi:MAG: nucleotidyltransferase domain-containing protein, partial [Nitrospinae bacterium]|nr:nucleotidyltransferase domain-containing protein [Nitrospinota bacterium]